MSSYQDEIAVSFAETAPNSAFRWACGALAAIGTVWIFLLMFLIVADVLGRNLFNSPITGVAEFAGRSVVGIVFLQLGAAIVRGRMTRSEFLLRRLPLRLQRLIEGLFALVGVGLFAILAYISWPEFMVAWQSNEFFGVRGVYTVATWPFKLLLVVGSVMAAIAYLLLALSFIKQPAEGGGS